MALLTLDMATQSGWAAYSPSLGVIYGTHKLPTTHDDVGRFVAAFQDWLVDDLFPKVQPTRICFEAPFVGPKMSQQTACKLFGLKAVLELTCFRNDILCREANIPAVRKAFLGRNPRNRDEAKRAVIEMCRMYGWKPKNDDEADALAIMDYAAGQWGLRRPWGEGPLLAPGRQTA